MVDDHWNYRSILKFYYPDTKFMKLSYAVMMQSPSAVLKREDSIEIKVTAINEMIKFFEEKEEYEKCTNLQKLKQLLHLDISSEEDDDTIN